jgi:hypothetical protein
MIQAEALEALACGALVDEILGGRSSIEIDVWIHTFNISRGTLIDACGELIGEVEGRALGIFEMDTPMEIGGGVTLSDDDGDGAADRMTSAPDHGGHLMLAGPRAISPPVEARFTGRAVPPPG